MNTMLVLVLSSLLCLASAADESKENSFVGHLSNTITYESKKGAEELAAFWDSNQKTDHSSIEEFLKALDVKVLAMVKVDVAGLVRNSLGKAVTKPESTGMYRVLQSIIKRLTVGFTLGRARTITKNEKMKGNGPSQDEDDDWSKSIANWYDGVANKNVTEEEKNQLINKAQAQIDAFIKRSLNAGKQAQSKVSTRSGSFFYNQHLQQQQQKSSSSVAHKLTSLMTSNMCSPQPPSYITNCHSSACQPHCPNCQPGYGQSNNYAGSTGHHSSYDHASSSLGSSSSNFGGVVGSGNLIGNGQHTRNGQIESMNSGHHSSYNHASASNFGGVGSGSLIGGGQTSNGLIAGMSDGHHSSYNHASGSNYAGVGSSSLVDGRLTGGNLGHYGNSHSSSGNSHNSHVSAYDASMSGSSNSHIGHRGNQDISGTYSGIANLWSLNNPNGQSGVSGNSNFASSGLGSNSFYGETSHLGGDVYNNGNSYNHNAGGLSNVHGHGLGNAGGHYNSGHYSASNSKSSKSDSSASHLSYGKEEHIW